MTYALQNERLKALKAECDRFYECFVKAYMSKSSVHIDGVTSQEEESLLRMLTFVENLEEEFDKWDFDGSVSGAPYRNGVCAPCLKEHLKT